MLYIYIIIFCLYWDIRFKGYAFPPTFYICPFILNFNRTKEMFLLIYSHHELYALSRPCMYHIVLYYFIHYDYFALLIQLSNLVLLILLESFFRVSSWWREKEEMGIYMWEFFWFKLGKLLSGKPHIHFGTSLSSAITISSMWFNSPNMKGRILWFSQTVVFSENVESIRI